MAMVVTGDGIRVGMGGTTAAPPHLSLSKLSIRIPTLSHPVCPARKAQPIIAMATIQEASARKLISTQP